jgi:hypothetical protein
MVVSESSSRAMVSQPVAGFVEEGSRQPRELSGTGTIELGIL